MLLADLKNVKSSLVLAAVFGGPFLIIVGLICFAVSVAMLTLNVDGRGAVLSLLGVSLISSIAGGGVSIWAARRLRLARLLATPESLLIKMEHGLLTVAGQSVVIDETSAARMKAILGKPDSSMESNSAPWFDYVHHVYGIQYGTDPSTSALIYLDVFLSSPEVKEDLSTKAHTPDRAFTGALKINGVQVTDQTSRQEFAEQNTPTVDLDDDSFDYSITQSDFKINFFLSSAGGCINRLRIVRP